MDRLYGRGWGGDVGGGGVMWRGRSKEKNFTLKYKFCEEEGEGREGGVSEWMGGVMGRSGTCVHCATNHTPLTLPHNTPQTFEYEGVLCL